MNNMPSVIATGAVLVLVSSQAQAHTGGSNVGLLHLLSGEHFIMIALAGVFAVGLTRLYRRFR